MRVLISGGSGLIGRALTRALRDAGHETTSLVRDAARKGTADVDWTPGRELDPAAIAGFDAVIHLAGRPVAGRWTAALKKEVLESRTLGTSTIANAVAASFRQTGKPTTLISASGIGYYGSRGDELLTEQSAPGSGFLADVCTQWEAATSAASEAGVRVAIPRIGLVLTPTGGALAKILPIFKLGVAGRIGDGRQWWSWITLDDLVAALLFALENTSVRGPFNAVTASSTNGDFTKTLARVLHRPAVFPVPAPVMRMVLGEAADELVLASQRAVPEVLRSAGYRFRDPELENALRRILSK